VNFEEYLNDLRNEYYNFGTSAHYHVTFDEAQRFEETGKLDDPPLIVTSVWDNEYNLNNVYDCREQEGVPYITNVPPQSSAGTAVLRYT
jgi:hypothetical protein